MPELVTSPSDFIYRRNCYSSLIASKEDDTTMNLEERDVSGYRPLHPPSSVQPPWKAVNSLPSCGHKVPLQNFATPPDINHRCPVCYRQETGNTGSVYIPGCNSGPESPYFATDADQQRQNASAKSDYSSQPVSHGLGLPLPDSSSLPDRALSVATSTTETNSSGISSISSNSDERTLHICAIIHAVHDTCLQSTRTYLDSHLANRRARTSNSPLLTGGYSSTSRSGLKIEGGDSSRNVLESEKSSSSSGSIPVPTNSLLKNVSGICTMLWDGSQTNRLNVLNVERVAVDNMGRLLCWAETVSLSDSDEWQMAEEDVLWRVLEGGSNLCTWLGVPDGIQTMSRLESDATNSGYGP